MEILRKEDVAKMSYVQLIASISEINRPPGGKDSIRRIVLNTFLTEESNVLDVGCNTGYSTFEIAHLAKCHVIGVDISEEMIGAAQSLRSEDSFDGLVDFKVADGMALPFLDETFDLTMSGGSTAFIDDKAKALQEYARVTKVWGFVADVNFYYRRKAPKSLIQNMNRLMGINIKPWEREYWTELYSATGLEVYYNYFADVYVPSKREIADYCEEMSKTVHADDSARELIKKRLIEIMTLFADNHRYLAYGVFVLRKRDKKEQISLFGA